MFLKRSCFTYSLILRLSILLSLGCLLESSPLAVAVEVGHTVSGLTAAKVDSGDLGVQDIQNDGRMQYSVLISVLKVRGELVTPIMGEFLAFSDSQIKTLTWGFKLAARLVSFKPAAKQF